jgi:nitroreductase
MEILSKKDRTGLTCGEWLRMELDEAIKGRRSIRRYRKRSIEDSVIEELIDLARHAPSSMNGQPWTFTIVRDYETKRKLVEIKNKYCPIEKQEYRADFLQNASAVIVVCVDRNKSYDREIENGVLAAANLMLAAHSRGLGSVYMSASRRDEPAVSEAIRQILGIPGHVDPISILPLGYPDETPESKNMNPLNGIISYEYFGKR